MSEEPEPGMQLEIQKDPVVLEDGLTMWTDPAVRDEAWRSAQRMSQSQLVPEAYQGKPADCMVAMDYARQLGVSPLVVLQNVHVVKGKPTLAAVFAVTLANQRGPFERPIRYRIKGEGKTLSVTAYATFRDTGEEVSATVDMRMAEAEGWTKLDRNGKSKYVSMPEQMLHYRAAMFLIRRACPDVLMGFQTRDEVQDIYAARSPMRRSAGRAIPEQDPTVQDLRDKVAQEAEEAKVEPAPTPVDGEIIPPTSSADLRDQSEGRDGAVAGDPF